jgi:predicted permease
MTTFTATLTPMLTLFLCMATGFIFSKCNILSDGSSKVMAKLETWIFCPALNFMTMVRFCTVDSIGEHLTNILFGSLCVALGMTIAILLSRFFASKGSSERGIYAYGLAFANGGYMGDPIVLSLFGEVGLSYYKIFYLPFSLMINSWGISVLIPDTNQKGGIWSKLLNASSVSMLVGIAVGLSGLGRFLPVFVTDSLDALKVCMGPVAMLLAGVTVAKYDVSSMLRKGKVYVASALRLLVIPTVLILFLFGVKTLMNHGMGLSIGNDALFLLFFATATPLGLNTVVFPEAYGGSPETGASMALISHVLCVVTIPLMYAIMVAAFGTPFA